MPAYFIIMKFLSTYGNSATSDHIDRIFNIKRDICWILYYLVYFPYIYIFLSSFPSLKSSWFLKYRTYVQCSIWFQVNTLTYLGTPLSKCLPYKLNELSTKLRIIAIFEQCWRFLKNVTSSLDISLLFKIQNWCHQFLSVGSLHAFFHDQKNSLSYYLICNFFFSDELRKFTISDFPKQTHFGDILITKNLFFTL